MVTWAPRAAARTASSPQPVPISSTVVPGPVPVRSSSASILRRCASASVSPGRRTARSSRSWSDPGTARTGRRTGRSAVGCCAGRPRWWPSSAAGSRGMYQRRSACSGARHDGGHPLGEHGEQADQVGGDPVPGHVGLGRARPFRSRGAGRRRPRGGSPGPGRRGPPPPDTLPSGAWTWIGSLAATRRSSTRGGAGPGPRGGIGRHGGNGRLGRRGRPGRAVAPAGRTWPLRSLDTFLGTVRRAVGWTGRPRAAIRMPCQRIERRSPVR